MNFKTMTNPNKFPHYQLEEPTTKPCQGTNSKKKQL